MARAATARRRTARAKGKVVSISRGRKPARRNAKPKRLSGREITNRMMNEPVRYGGIVMPRWMVIRDLQEKGIPPQAQYAAGHKAEPEGTPYDVANFEELYALIPEWRENPHFHGRGRKPARRSNASKAKLPEWRSEYRDTHYSVPLYDKSTSLSHAKRVAKEQRASGQPAKVYETRWEGGGGYSTYHVAWPMEGQSDIAPEWGVFEWTGTGRYSREQALKLFTNEKVAERFAGGIRGGESVVVRRTNPHFPGRLGTGQRFAECVEEMEGREGVYDPAGLCAVIGRRKYGKAGMAQLTARGRRNPGELSEVWVKGAGSRTYLTYVHDAPHAASAADVLRNDGWEVEVKPATPGSKRGVKGSKRGAAKARELLRRMREAIERGAKANPQGNPCPDTDEGIAHGALDQHWAEHEAMGLGEPDEGGVERENPQWLTEPVTWKQAPKPGTTRLVAKVSHPKDLRGIRAGTPALLVSGSYRLDEIQGSEPQIQDCFEEEVRRFVEGSEHGFENLGAGIWRFDPIAVLSKRNPSWLSRLMGAESRSPSSTALAPIASDVLRQAYNHGYSLGGESYAANRNLTGDQIMNSARRWFGENYRAIPRGTTEREVLSQYAKGYRTGMLDGYKAETEQPVGKGRGGRRRNPEMNRWVWENSPLGGQRIVAHVHTPQWLLKQGAGPVTTLQTASYQRSRLGKGGDTLVEYPFRSQLSKFLEGSRHRFVRHGDSDTWTLPEYVGNPDRHPNPESAAADLSHDFHGRPAETITTVRDEVRSHEWLAGLGALTEIEFRSESGRNVTLGFDAESADPTLLSSSEDGRQLYLVGGDQSVDLKSFGMDGKRWVRDSMVLGTLNKITYRTRKGFDDFEVIDYYHRLGEETKVRPKLIYDTLNRELSIAGGQYSVERPGIIN